jgi:hypothetical protein
VADAARPHARRLLVADGVGDPRPARCAAHADLGPPDVHPERGDHPQAWASTEKDRGPEWLELAFETTRPALAVAIVETHNPGAVVRIDDLSDPAEPVVVFETRGEPIVSAGHVWLVTLPAPRTVTKLRVVLDTTRVTGWNELDAVGLLVDYVAEAKTPPKKRSERELPAVTETIPGATAHARDALPVAVWAGAVSERTSEYSTGAWSAERALGPPDVWPASGDDNRAWAQAASNAGYEWVTVRVPRTEASSIVVVETFHPGAVVRVDDLTDPLAATALWEGPLPSQDERRVLSIELPAPRVVETLRVVLDTRLVPGWNELDAIGVVPAQPARR